MKPRKLMARTAEWLARIRVRLPLGRRGERAAEKYLKRNGYRIVARNFRAAGAEIDLVAIEGKTLAPRRMAWTTLRVSLTHDSMTTFTPG